MLPRSQSGYSLLEAMVALLVLSIGLLGVAMLQVKGQRFNSDAYMRTQATALAGDLFDRIRMNQDGFFSVVRASYPASITQPPLPTGVSDCTSVQCDPATLAKYDIFTWYSDLNRFLSPVPTGVNRAVIACVSSCGAGSKTPVYTITVNWTDHDLVVGQQWQVQP